MDELHHAKFGPRLLTLAGSGRVRFTTQDFRNFLDHPLMREAAETAVQASPVASACVQTWRLGGACAAVAAKRAVPSTVGRTRVTVSAGIGSVRRPWCRMAMGAYQQLSTLHVA